MYKREPLGRHLVSVCTNFSCKVRGAQEVYDALKAHLGGIGHQRTTEDGAITLEHAECLGNCEGAPVVSVDYLNYEMLDAEAAIALVDQVRAGTVPLAHARPRLAGHPRDPAPPRRHRPAGPRRPRPAPGPGHEGGRRRPPARLRPRRPLRVRPR